MYDSTLVRTEHGKPRVLGAAIEINGRKALAYMKNGKIEGYIYWEELFRKLCDSKPKQLKEQ